MLGDTPEESWEIPNSRDMDASDQRCTEETGVSCVWGGQAPRTRQGWANISVLTPNKIIFIFYSFKIREKQKSPELQRPRVASTTACTHFLVAARSLSSSLKVLSFIGFLGHLLL